MTETAQARLVQAIWSNDAAAASALAAAGWRGVGEHGLQRGLAAYREHAKALSVRALGAAFPRLQAWLGVEDFAGLAWAFARQSPPQQGDLARWGAGLPVFLAGVPQMEPEPLALAHMDWTLHALSWQADEVVAPDLFEVLQREGDSGLQLSSHLQRLRLPTLALACAAQVDAPAWPAPDGRQADCELVLWRAGWKPCWAVLPPGWGHWLDRLAAGDSLGTAIDLTLDRVDDFDAGTALHRAFTAGWVVALRA